MRMTARDLLEAVRYLLSDKQHWCQGTLAKTESGASVPPVSDKARSWCLVGALHKKSSDLGTDGREYTKAIKALEREMLQLVGPYASLMGFNDNNTHENVLRLLDRAIKKL